MAPQRAHTRAGRRALTTLRRVLAVSFAVGLLALAGAPSAFAVGFDFGDAPDGQPTGYGAGGSAVGRFPSLLASNGARAADVSVKLGPGVDVEADALVVNRDRFDDGVRSAALAPCRTNTMRVTVVVPAPAPAANAFLNMYFDWNRNGRWGGADACAPEWAVRNFRIDLSAQTALSQEYAVQMPAGLFTDVWFRVTLSVGQPRTDETGAGQFARGEVEDYPPRVTGQRFGATCVPKKLALFHGKAGNFQIVPLPGSAPILSSQLSQAQPANTPWYRITKNNMPPHSFRFRSKKVDPPTRTVLYIVLIRVRFGTPGNIVANIVKKCVVTVTHAETFFGARCGGIQISHLSSGTLVIVPLPFSARISSTSLSPATPANTANYKLKKLGPPGHRYRFTSKKLDGPTRTELYKVRIRVVFGAPGAVVGQTLVICDVRVVHTAPHLTITLLGTATGKVTSTPAAIDCPPTCTGSFNPGTEVELTQRVGANALFAGWAGDCTGQGPCRLRMDANSEVSATFNPDRFQLRVTPTGDGRGVVSGPGINCGTFPGADCTESYMAGTKVDLNCTAFAGATCSFGGCDLGNGTTACTLTMNADRAVTCNFAAGPAPLQRRVSGASRGSGGGKGELLALHWSEVSLLDWELVVQRGYVPGIGEQTTKGGK